jgi:hypothetical protein
VTKLARIASAVALGVAAGSTFAIQPGCSSSTTDTGGTAGAVGQPPAKPAGATAGTGAERNLALHTWQLGDKPRGVTASSNVAWKKFGYNLDGKVSTRASTDGCKLVSGASATVRDDGENGIDNSLGANILPIILNASASASDDINAAVADGKFTLMFDLTGLTGEATQTATGIGGVVLAGGNFGGKPTFTKADNWPVRPETLTDKTNPKSSSIKLSDGYVVNGQFVSQQTLNVSLVFGGVAISLPINRAIVSFTLKGSSVTDGTIAGVVSTSQLIGEFKKIAGALTTSLCGAGFSAIATQIQQASDIMADGTAGDPSTECNGISLGLGFTADEIGLPTKVGDVSGTVADKCAADGGTD